MEGICTSKCKIVYFCLGLVTIIIPWPQKILTEILYGWLIVCLNCIREHCEHNSGKQADCVDCHPLRSVQIFSIYYETVLDHIWLLMWLKSSLKQMLMDFLIAR